MNRPIIVLMTLAIAVVLAGCQDRATSGSSVAKPRPVVTAVVRTDTAETAAYSGSIEPRYETSLGFRNLGRLVFLGADVGDVVKKGQRVAAIDPASFADAVRAAQANVEDARAKAKTALTNLERARFLQTKTVASDAALDSAEKVRKVANAVLLRAEADLAKAESALADTTLTAPYDGVITGRGAEKGQVVGIGQTVISVAQVDSREAVIDVPVRVAAAIEIGDPFVIALQRDPAKKAAGKVREIAPQSDVRTRTNRIRIQLEMPTTTMRLGALIVATGGRNAPVSLSIPEKAVKGEGEEAGVWVVDNETGIVRWRAVQLGERVGGRVVVLSGLTAGERVVAAGIHSLQNGQAVTLSPEDPS